MGGYGSFKQYCREIENDRPLSEHLDYGEINDTQKIWADFLNTGILKEPSTEDRSEILYVMMKYTENGIQYHIG